jgi:lauroyl/myristoyl acyltransferase
MLHNIPNAKLNYQCWIALGIGASIPRLPWAWILRIARLSAQKFSSLFYQKKQLQLNLQLALQYTRNRQYQTRH